MAEMAETRRFPTLLRLVLALALGLRLLLTGAPVPVAAGEGWIEICSAGGVARVALTPDMPPPPPSETATDTDTARGDHCDRCLAGLVTTLAAASALDAVERPAESIARAPRAAPALPRRLLPPAQGPPVPLA